MTDLSRAIAEVLNRTRMPDAPAGALAKAAEGISARYRDGRPTLLESKDEADAYLATRLPATAAAIGRVMGEVRDRWEGFAPSTQLDLGAGPGAAAWAAAEIWPGMEVVLVDRDDRMLAAGEALARAGDATRFGPWHWKRYDITGESLRSDEAADLVTATYVLGELAPDAALAVATSAWDVTTGCLILVEPGTPAGFERIRSVREALLGRGADLLAPCPHQGPCPIEGEDWCHFAARLSRSSVHRRLKGAELGFEDEKFSYVAFARPPGDARRVAGRVVRRPQRRRRYVELAVCTGDEVTGLAFGQSHPAYREAADLGWGDAVPARLLGRGAGGDVAT